MPTLRNLQHEFLNYLLDDKADEIIESIESSTQRTAAERLSLYKNAYILRLKEALTTDYAQLHSYLGDELFDTLMLSYIEKYPSHHPSLRYFGKDLVKLIECMEPFKNLPEVAEIARIEQAFAHSFDAADHSCATIDQLAELKPESWVTLTLSFNGAVQLLPQQYNSFQVWKALSADNVPPKKTRDESTWLIWREHMVSRYRALETDEVCALQIMMSGGNFVDMCTALLEYCSEQETPQRASFYLQQWLTDQLICEIKS